MYVVCGAKFLELERVSDSLVGYICFFVVKNLPTSAWEARGVGLIPGWERSPGGEDGAPLQYSCLENPMVFTTMDQKGEAFSFWNHFALYDMVSMWNGVARSQAWLSDWTKLIDVKSTQVATSVTVLQGVMCWYGTSLQLGNGKKAVKKSQHGFFSLNVTCLLLFFFFFPLSFYPPWFPKS